VHIWERPPDILKNTAHATMTARFAEIADVLGKVCNGGIEVTTIQAIGLSAYNGKIARRNILIVRAGHRDRSQ